jgi:type IV secretory pathway VirB2 component (pilin)
MTLMILLIAMLVFAVLGIMLMMGGEDEGSAFFFVLSFITGIVIIAHAG